MIIKENQPRKESSFKDPYRLTVRCPEIGNLPVPQSVKALMVSDITKHLADSCMKIEILENNSDGTYQICLPGVQDWKQFLTNRMSRYKGIVTESRTCKGTKLVVKEDWDDDEDLGDLDDGLCNYIEANVDYEVRAKFFTIDEVGDHIEYQYISQEYMDDVAADDIAQCILRWTEINKPEWSGKTCKGVCWCRNDPADTYSHRFTLGGDNEVESDYEYGVVADSYGAHEEYFDNLEDARAKAKEWAKDPEVCRAVYSEDGEDIRIIYGEPGSDAYDWDTYETVPLELSETDVMDEEDWD